MPPRLRWLVDLIIRETKDLLMVAINFLGDGLQAAYKRSVAMRIPNLATMGFLAVAFAMVGLIGLVASYAAPLPLERALARDAALDAVLATGGDAAAIEALRPRLAESADALLPAGGGPAVGN